MRASLASACLLVGLALTSPVRAADPDPWVAKDKALHFGVSAGIASGSYAAGAALLDARGHALIAAAGITLAIGASKELFDLTMPGWGDPSWRDFAADVAGTIVGLAVAWSVDLFVRGVRDARPLLRAPRGSSSRTVTSSFVVSF